MNKIKLILAILLLPILGISQKLDTLNQIEIVSNRADNKTPVTQFLINKEDYIQKSYIGQDPAYILGKTPSITFYSDNGLYNSYTYFRLRGLDQTRINMTLNGVPLNEPEDQGAYFCNYGDFGANINSIQIQRGVGVSSYGTSSYAGSINFESRNLLDTTQTSIEYGYGSYSTSRFSLSHSTGLMKDNIAAYTRFSSLSTDGYRYNSFNNSKTFFNSIGYYGNKTILRLTTFSGQSANGMAYLATNIEDINIDRRTNYLTSKEKDYFYQSLTSLQMINKLSKNRTLNSTIFYNKLDGQYNVLFSPNMNNFYLNSNFYGLISSYNFDYKKFKSSIGLNLNTYQRFHKSSIDPLYKEYIYQNSGIKNDASIFMKLFYNINSKLILFEDIQYRYTSFQYLADKSNTNSLSKLEWNFLNPKGGIKYKASDRLNYYLSIGKTHREPTRNDLFNGYDDVSPISGDVYTTFAGDTINIQNIKPESVTDLELGLDYSKSNLLLHINLYYMDFKNEIAPIGQLSYIGLPLRKNISRSNRTGIESNISYRYKLFTFNNSLNISYNKISEFKTDYDFVSYSNTDPLLTPNFISNSGVDFRHRYFNVGLTHRYVAKSYLDNTQNNNFVTPSYNLFDSYLVISYKFVQIKFTVNNILNTSYYNSGYVSINNDGNKTSAYFIGAPRNYFISLNLRF